MTTPDLTLDERFAILTLMVATREDKFELSNADLDAETGVTIGRAERENLVGQGLITARQDGRTWMHELTDKGWHRVEEELASGAPSGAPEDVQLLYGLMGRIAKWMSQSDLHVADVFYGQDEGQDEGLPASSSVLNSDLRALQDRRAVGNPSPAAAAASSAVTASTPSSAPGRNHSVAWESSAEAAR